jgi:hypothetical protein
MIIYEIQEMPIVIVKKMKNKKNRETGRWDTDGYCIYRGRVVGFLMFASRS